MARGHVNRRLGFNAGRVWDMSFRQRISAAVKAFTKSASQLWFPAGNGYGAPADLTTGAASLAWSKWGAASAVVVNSAVFACVSKIAEEMGGATWRVVDGNGNTLGSSDDNHSTDPLTRYLKDMQYRYDGVSPFELWAYATLTTGENYWQVVYDRTGRIVGLEWLNPLWTNPDVSMGYITKFDYQPPAVGGYIQIPPDQMIYTRNRINLMTDYFGFSPVMTLIGSNNIGVIQAAGKAMLAYFNNDGMPYAIFSPDGTHKKDYNREESAYIREQLALGKHASAKYRTLIFPYTFKADVFDTPDLQKWADLLRAVEPDAYRVFGMPPPVVGDTTTPYQNSEENRWNYHEKMVSRFMSIANTINTALMPLLYGDDSDAVFEFELTPYQHIAEQERQAAINLFDRGVAGGNELRAAFGWKESPQWEVRFDPLTQGLLPLNAPIAAPPALPAPVAPVQAAPAQPTPDTDKAGGSLFVGLKLANNVDLIALQSQVKRLAGETSVEWTDPADFHITLAYAPVADEVAAQGAIEILRAIPVPELKINPGSLRAFDTVGRHALHFRVRRNSALSDYQASVVEALTDAGIEVSAFTRQWIPHITMGYAESPIKTNFTTPLLIPTSDVMVMLGENVLWDSAGEASIAQAVKAYEEYNAYRAYRKTGKHHKRAFVWETLDADTAMLVESDFAENEAAAAPRWAKALKARAGVSDFDRLTDETMPADVKAALDVWLGAGVKNHHAQKAARALYEGIIGAKALSREQSRFEQAAFQIFRRAQLERTTRAQFEGQLFGLIESYILPSLLAGYEDGGIPDHELTALDRAWIDKHIDKQRGYVEDVGGKLFADDKLTDDEIKGKPRMWWNLSVHPAYNEGLARAARNSLAMFKRGNTSDSCYDCKNLDGKVYPMSDWFALFGRQLVPCNRTECGGYRCECEIIPVRGVPRSKGKLPRLRGSRKSVLEFEDEPSEVIDGQ